ncbi:MAG TPA: glutaminyl-peptide cyclotransferase [Roseiflexaceae bacterium]|nr:glutaminyl-peptide cyclotransferase [Roseiflexaceae bacterium]
MIATRYRLCAVMLLVLLGGCAARTERSVPVGEATRVPVVSGTAPVSSSGGEPPSAVLSTACVPFVDPPGKSTPVYSYTISTVYDHSPDSFTEGLVYTNGLLYEGTGRGPKGPHETWPSRVSFADLEANLPLKERSTPDNAFGEGLTVFNGLVYQITYGQTGYIYAADTLTPTSSFAYTTATRQGWGLTHDGTRLILSDGSDRLYTMDPETFQTTPWLAVAAEGTPVSCLNELEYIDGLIYANIFQTQYIARIDPGSGRVVSWINLEGLKQQATGPDTPSANAVANGIAYDTGGQRLFVTGKLWSKLFVIDLVPPQ